jgi:hypothetical protein
MQCIKCGHPNPGSVLYCQRCGLKLDMTADEIQTFYQQKIRDEKRLAMEHYAMRALIFAVCLLLIAGTVMVLAGGGAEDTSFIPSATMNAEFVKTTHEVNIPVRPVHIPIEEGRR